MADRETRDAAGHTYDEDHHNQQDIHRTRQMATLRRQRQPCTPAPPRPRRTASILPTPPRADDAQQPPRRRSQRIASQTQRERAARASAASPSPAPISAAQLPHVPSPPPPQQQEPPQTPRITRERTPDVSPVPHNQQFCLCCGRPSGEAEAATGEEAADSTARCAHTTSQQSHSGASDGLSGMDRQLRDAREYIERRRRGQ